MIIMYAPQIKHLIDMAVSVSMGQNTKEELREARENALQFNYQTKAEFLYFSKSKVQDEEVQKIYDEIIENINLRENLLIGIDEYFENSDNDILLNLIRKIEDVSFNLYGLGIRFNELGDSFIKLSPLPFIDDFLKVAVNVNNGLLDASALTEKIPLIIRRKETMEEDFNEFSKFYPEENDLIRDFRKSLDDLELGIGAIYNYTENKNREDLMTGIRILSIISTELEEVFALIDSTREHKGFSLNPYVDYFMRSAKMAQEGTISSSDFIEGCRRLKFYLDDFFTEFDQFKTDFLIYPSIEEKFTPDFDKYHKALEEDITRITDIEFNNPEFSKTIKIIGGNFENLIQLRQTYYEAVLKRKDLSFDPELSDLQQAIIGVYNEVVPMITLNKLLISQMSRFHSLKLRVSKIPSNIKVEEISRSISLIIEGLNEIDKYFEDKNIFYLANGIEIIEDTAEEVKNVEDEIAQLEWEKDMVPCIRCGFKNPSGTRFCKNCSTVLPATHGMQSLSEIEVLEGELGMSITGDRKIEMEEIKLLEKIIIDIETGTAGDEEVQEFIRSFSKKLSTALEYHKKRMDPILKKNPDDQLLKEKYDEFRSGLGLFQDAIEEISHYLINKDIIYIENGYHKMIESLLNFEIIIDNIEILANN